MRGYQIKSVMGRVAGVGGLGALMFTYGCGGSQSALGVRAQEAAGAQAGAPVVVTCEPNQRTVVRPAMMNGAAISQVECVSTGPALASAEPAIAQPLVVPVSYRSAAPRATSDGYYRNAPDTRVVPVTSYPATVARPVRAQQIVYDDRPVRTVPRQRSVKKSAVIIGSSAGAGAGLGAAIGGKKGALIGAVVGGGGAALWDQITRRRN
jgi:hypothetical protein